MGSEDDNGAYGAPADALTLWKFLADFSTPANSSFTLANTIPIRSLQLGPRPLRRRQELHTAARNNQPNRPPGLRQRPIFRLAYRNMGTYQSLLTNQSVSAGTGPSGEVSGVRWWEVRSPASSPVMYQQGTYAPGLTDGINRWMGSIAMNGRGNIGARIQRRRVQLSSPASITLVAWPATRGPDDPG